MLEALLPNEPSNDMDADAYLGGKVGRATWTVEIIVWHSATPPLFVIWVYLALLLR